MPDPVADVVGELISDGSGVKPADIPLSQGFSEHDLAALFEGDPEPTQIVCRIGPGDGGRRGWVYTPAALEQLAATVAAASLPGFVGHDHSETPPEQWGTPIVRWIGAKWDGTACLLRGAVERSQAEIKRQLKGGQIKAPSILTVPRLWQHGNQSIIDAFERILSIDLVPPGGQAGMRTAAVTYAGETRPTTPQGGRDMDLASLNNDIGLPASASEQTYRERARALFERAQASQLADLRLVAGEQGISSELVPLAARLVADKLDPCASRTEMARVVGELRSDADFQAARGRATIGGTVSPPPPRGGMVESAPDMSVFERSAFRVGA
jgi:hypothetical protein